MTVRPILRIYRRVNTNCGAPAGAARALRRATGTDHPQPRTRSAVRDPERPRRRALVLARDAGGGERVRGRPTKAPMSKTEEDSRNIARGRAPAELAERQMRLRALARQLEPQGAGRCCRYPTGPLEQAQNGGRRTRWPRAQGWRRRRGRADRSRKTDVLVSVPSGSDRSHAAGSPASTPHQIKQT